MSAPASGQGKTSITAAIARYHASRGRRVRVFKTGPDFIDPTFLARASGHPVHPLDLWLTGEVECRWRLHQAAREADLIVIEGVMGLFDGSPSSADLAERFGVPVLAVVDAQAMAQTFGAVAYGLAHYRKDLPFAGVLANQVASEGHGALLAESLPPDIPYFGAFPACPETSLPSRHLGLHLAEEIDATDVILERLAANLERTALAELPPAVDFPPGKAPSVSPLLQGVRIAVARDAAFCFVYQANLDLLRAMGAEVLYFSPLNDAVLPEADSLYLPGGYPELHLRELAANASMKRAIAAHAQEGKPVLAECGGMLYLLDRLEYRGESAPLCGLLPGVAALQDKLAGIGLQSADIDGEGALRAHTFHHSLLESPMTPLQRGRRQDGGEGEAIYRQGFITASYLHWYFPSCPRAAAVLLKPR